MEPAADGQGGIERLSLNGDKLDPIDISKCIKEDPDKCEDNGRRFHDENSKSEVSEMLPNSNDGDSMRPVTDCQSGIECFPRNGDYKWDFIDISKGIKEDPDKCEDNGRDFHDKDSKSEVSEMLLNSNNGDNTEAKETRLKEEEIIGTATDENLEKPEEYIDQRALAIERIVANIDLRKSFRCNLCGRLFSCESTFAEHLLTHTSETSGVCKAQPKSRRNRNIGKPHCCNICNKQFARKHHLLNHMRIHTGEKPFTCDVCNRSFTMKQHLRGHMHMHKDDKPFVCDICNKTFSRKQYLLTHSNLHTGEKTFTCSICNKIFIHRQSLMRHVRSHGVEKPFTCNICNKSFALKQYLLNHTYLHTGDKPFLCSICDKPFTQKTNLTKHMRVHTGERPFSCSICNQSFTHKQHVDTHMRIHVR